TVKLECGNGEINFEKIAVSAIEFDLKMKNGNVFLHNVTSPLKMNVSIDNGNLNLKNNNTGDLEASIKKGALIVNTNRQTNLVLKCTNGVVNTYFKGNTVEEHTTPESFTEIFPSYEQLGSAESGAIPQLIANIDMGDASIYYGYETEEEESEEETGESEEEKTGDEEDQAA
ncbi:MAG: DUF4097 family beta strand repeat protein, partial [Clostridia bacterium]|nr:DUF4097 family beta strand repeat protein [Clostridia bacterium]